MIYRQTIGTLTTIACLGHRRLDQFTPDVLAATFAALRAEGHGSRVQQQA